MHHGPCGQRFWGQELLHFIFCSGRGFRHSVEELGVWAGRERCFLDVESNSSGQQTWATDIPSVCVCVCVCVCMLSCVWLSVTPQTVAHQAPLSMVFSRQEYWSGLLFPSPGDLPDPEINPASLALQVDSLPQLTYNFILLEWRDHVTPYSTFSFKFQVLHICWWLSVMIFLMVGSLLSPNNQRQVVFAKTHALLGWLLRLAWICYYQSCFVYDESC